MRRTFTALRTILALAWRTDRRLTVLSLALPLVTSVTGVLVPLWMKLLVDAVLAHDEGRAVGWAVAMVGSLLTGALLGHLWGPVVLRWSMRTSQTLHVHLCHLSGAVPGIEHLESPEYADRLQLLSGDSEQLTYHAQSLVDGLGFVVRVAVSLSLLASLHPVLLLLPGLGLIPFWTSGRAQRIEDRHKERMAEPKRRLAHIVDIARRPHYGKEARVFGLSTLLLERQARGQQEVRRADLANDVRVSLVTNSGPIAFVLGWIAAVGFVLSQAAHGRATVGDVIMAITLAGQVSGLSAQGAGLVSKYVAATQAMSRYKWLRDYTRQAIEARAHATSIPPERLSTGIELRDVSFTYPGTSTPVLSSVNLSIPAGTTVAIVGENGAGKTSLVKLLCGFYEPDEGVITVDGVPLTDIDLIHWRQRITASFQDFCRYELLVQETVGVGHLPDIENNEAVLTAIEAANATDVLHSLPNGLAMQLGKSWPGGTDLSGGQWQKLGLARAMMRKNPLLLLLDEPTSAIDAQTEHALLERYAGTAASAAVITGAITVLVSHRFSTVSMADLIVVVDNGRISESGSHSDLMRKGGLYAELYSLQAAAYQ